MCDILLSIFAFKFNLRRYTKFLERGSRCLNFTSTVFVERGDFREVDDKSFFGMAPGKTVRLLFGYNVTCTGVNKVGRCRLTLSNPH
jgi:glutaminyl-tRNA synthetase